MIPMLAAIQQCIPSRANQLTQQSTPCALAECRRDMCQKNAPYESASGPSHKVLIVPRVPSGQRLYCTSLGTPERYNVPPPQQHRKLEQEAE